MLVADLKRALDRDLDRHGVERNICSLSAKVGPGRHTRRLRVWLAKIAFHPELLTFSVEAGSLAGLHDSTPLGDHRRTLLGVPLPAGPHAREPRPPAATLHRSAEAPAADRAGGPGVLGRAASRVAKWSDAVVIVKPETVIGWHPSGFSLYWRWLSKRGRVPGRAPVGREVRDLVRRMARENRWGAPRIHGELRKLGFMVSERTVSRYMRSHGRSPERRQSWLTFLRNHREVIVAMDFSRCRQ